MTYMRALILAVALGLVMAAAACGDGEPSPVTATAPPATVAPTAPSAPPPTTQATATPPEATRAPAATPRPSPTPRPTATPEPTPTPALFPLTVLDSNGNEVTFDKPPERIVAFDSAVVEILFAIDEGHRIAGTHDFVSYPPEAAEVPRVGGAFNINIEAVVALEPDLVFIFFDRFLPDLERAGLRVLYLESLNDDFIKIADTIRLWGRIAGNPTDAEALAVDFEARVTRIRDALANNPDGPTVFQDEGELWTPGPDTLVGEVFELLKLRNIAHDVSGYVQLSPEIIVQRDPEIIIASYGDTISGRPAFKDVAAVMDGRILVPESDALSIAGPRFINGIEALANWVYPGLLEPTPTPALFPLTVLDSNGNEVTFDKPPERIVAFDSAVVEILFAIDEGHRIAGTHDFVSYPPEAAEVPRVGGAFNINIEAVVALEPDLVFIFFDRFLPDLERAGLKVLYLESLNDDFIKIADTIRLWGRIAGNPTDAEALAVDFEARVTRIRDALANNPDGPTVFQDEGELWTPGPDTLVGEVFELLKLRNIAHDVSGYVQLSPEIIVQRDPEIIIASYGDTISGRPAFKEVAAVMDGRILVPESDALSIAGPRFIDGIEALANWVYPGLLE